MTKSGSLVGWGSNSYGSLGVGGRRVQGYKEVLRGEGHGKGKEGEGEGEAAEVAGEERTQGERWVKEFAAGWGHCMALDKDDKLLMWGVSHSFQLGFGKSNSVHFPKILDVSEVLAGKKIVAIGCGFEHSYFITEEGKLFFWGAGGAGQFGITDCSFQKSPKEFLWPVRVPNNLHAHWPKIFFWIFLGNSDRKSIFSNLPKEVVYHFVLALSR
jgi:alpha-tubulin suppressor-like RCC1 family protein